MFMRMSLFPHIVMTGIDAHGLLPPTAAPPNPAPIPTYATVHLHVSLVGGFFLTGKYTLSTSKTDGHGEILWQYDHGFLGPHIPAPPQASPSLALLLLGSSSKFWLPSFQVQHKPDGGLIARLNRSATPVAVSLGIFMISVQNCQDIGGAKSFVAPTGLSFQNVSTRYVNFTKGDFLAGFVGMVADALAALLLSVVGGRLFANSVRDNFICGALSNLGSGAVGNLAGAAIFGPVVGVIGLIAGAGAKMAAKELAGNVLYAGAAAGAAAFTSAVASILGSAAATDDPPEPDPAPAAATPAAATPPAATPPAATPAAAVAQTPTDGGAPQPADGGAPKPADAGAPNPADAGAPKPADAGAPKPADAGAPKPADAGAPKPADAGAPKPADAGAPKPADAGAPKPADAGAPKPADGGTR